MAGKLFHHIIKTQSIEAYQLLLYGKVSLISDMPNPNAPTNTGARASGRIPVAFCATNDSVGILGEDVDVGDDYNAIVQETLDKEITEKTRKNYRNRLKKIIDYWREHCNEYYQQGVRQVPIDELNDLSKYHFNKTEDIIYSSSNGGINVKFVMKFLAYTRKKKTGNFKTHGELWKYKDAITRCTTCRACFNGTNAHATDSSCE